VNRGLTGANPIKTTTIQDTSVTGKLSAVWLGTVPTGVIKISKVVSFGVDDLFFATTVTLKNMGTSTVYEVEYMRTVDPDPEVVRDSVLLLLLLLLLLRLLVMMMMMLLWLLLRIVFTIGIIVLLSLWLSSTSPPAMDRHLCHAELRAFAAVPERASCWAQQHRRTEHVPRGGQRHDVPGPHAGSRHGAPQLQGVALRLHQHQREHGVDRAGVDRVQQQQPGGGGQGH
jgi:hypothetical protein